jgi:hypothetical protein
MGGTAAGDAIEKGVDMAELAYGSPDVDLRMIWRERVFRRLVLACWWLPLLLWLGVLLLYYVFDWEGFVVAGAWMVPIGAGVLLAGLTMTAIWAVRLKGVARMNGEELDRMKVAWIVLLQCSNIGVATVCVMLAIDLHQQPRTYFTLRNDTGMTITRCRVDSRWRTSVKNALAPGDKWCDEFRSRWMGKLALEVEQGGELKRINLDVLEGWGGRYSVDVSVMPDLETKIEMGEID